MLELTKKDLVSVDGTKGLRVWWVTPPEKKAPVMVLAWTDLAIVRPKLSWPAGLTPGKAEGWGQSAFRLDYVRELERITLQQIAKIPDVYQVLGIKPKDTLALVPQHGKTKGARGVLYTALVTEEEAPRTFYVSQLSLRRLAKACDALIKNLYLRLYEIEGERMVLAYNHGLRGIMGLAEEPA